MRSRRGLSSVVGMVFAIVAIVTSIGYVTYSLNTLDQYNLSTLARNQQSINAGEESFQLFSTKFSPQTGGYKFNVTIANTGSIPINITRMWVQNTTATDWTNVYDINKIFGPGTLLTNIGQNSPVYANPSYTYNIKLVTSRGNALQFSIGSTNSNPLFMSAQMIPGSVHTKAYVTLLYEVVNNMTSNNQLVNIQPNTPSCVGGGTSPGSAAVVSGPIPSQYPSLPSGGIAIFKWLYNVTGTYQPSNYLNPPSVTCTVSLKNGLSANTASDTVIVLNGTK
jgi:hypothetical protein